MAKVSTYLNFPGTTEAAFNFYKSVFGGEFGGDGIMRMGDMPPQEGMPPIAAADKNYVVHVELPILGGHVIMGTDAVESLGQKLEAGNHMHVNLEPDSKEEADRLFNELSAGGNVTMPMADMFWGAYYGAFTDKYGINWMINFATK